MKVTITNTGTLSVPVSSTEGKGFSTLLDVGTPYELDTPDVTVLNVGDNPSALEELSEGLAKLITFWRDHTEQQADDSGTVSVSIQNHGTNGLRVLLGSNTAEVHVGAGGEYEAEALEYVEIRELGV